MRRWKRKARLKISKQVLVGWDFLWRDTAYHYVERHQWHRKIRVRLFDKLVAFVLHVRRIAMKHKFKASKIIAMDETPIWADMVFNTTWFLTRQWMSQGQKQWQLKQLVMKNLGFLSVLLQRQMVPNYRLSSFLKVLSVGWLQWIKSSKGATLHHPQTPGWTLILLMHRLTKF